jgi:hypothetical protein
LYNPLGSFGSSFQHKTIMTYYKRKWDDASETTEDSSPGPEHEPLALFEVEQPRQNEVLNLNHCSHSELCEHITISVYLYMEILSAYLMVTIFWKTYMWLFGVIGNWPSLSFVPRSATALTHVLPTYIHILMKRCMIDIAQQGQQLMIFSINMIKKIKMYQIFKLVVKQPCKRRLN